MLHAEIHGKVGEKVERLEDVLTSTVFGILFLAGADGERVLKSWLRKARTANDTELAIPDEEHVEWYQFWPQLEWEKRDVEPDLLMRIGRLLVVIEAKYRSGKSSENQLACEWGACRTTTHDYAEDVHHAIRSSSQQALIYLVRRARVAKERAYVTESSKRARAPMFMLSWEDLDETLRAEDRPARWVRDLRTFLRRREISAFCGFKGAFTPASSAQIDQLSQWRPNFTKLGGS